MKTLPDKFDAQWDAGDMGCGELVMQLNERMNQFPPGTVLLLLARDSGAIEDIPAWCRMTRNKLLSATHPEYFIERRNKDG